jgi:predicted nucleic acid-binding Zn ribbon protein
MNSNRCVCCGTIIPEGRQVCWECEHSIRKKEKVNDKRRSKRKKDRISKKV